MKKTFKILLIVLIPVLVLVVYVYKKPSIDLTAANLVFDEQDAAVRSIKKAMPAIVSIVVYEQNSTTVVDLNTGKKITNTKKISKGSGTGFLISADGLILTNKHVVNSASDPKTAIYRVIMHSGKRYYAQLIGTDPIYDLAVIKIFDKNLPYVELGDSDKLEQGMTVMAIGNSLGKYQDSVTKGIVSGLGRSLVATDSYGNQASLDNTIQTDAEINLGNSGGPLLNLEGKVVGINVATDIAGASLGFAIPINDAKPVIKTVKEVGRIIRPRVGLRYISLTPEIADERNLKQSSGALVIEGENGEPAITSGSPAEIAGIKSGDIIIEINNIKVTDKKTLLSIVQGYKPGTTLNLKIIRDNNTVTKSLILDEFIALN